MSETLSGCFLFLSMTGLEPRLFSFFLSPLSSVHCAVAPLTIYVSVNYCELCSSKMVIDVTLGSKIESTRKPNGNDQDLEFLKSSWQQPNQVKVQKSNSENSAQVGQT